MSMDRPSCFFIPSEYIALHFARMRPRGAGLEVLKAAVSLATVGVLCVGLAWIAG